jgi:hypothetical protein
MPSKAQWPHLLLTILVTACSENPAASREFDLTGAWYGANSVAVLDLHLSNATVMYPCSLLCTGQQTMQQVRLEGKYRDQRTGESIDLVSDTQRRTDGLVDFRLFLRDDGVSQVDGGTYATTRLVGQVANANTIEATLMTEYARSSGGNSITWTTWTGDSTTITLHRR